MKLAPHGTPPARIVLTAELVGRCERIVADAGPDPGVPQLSDGDYEDAAADIDRRAGAGPLHIFAYGSLLWKPVVAPAETIRATAEGWRRAFALEITRWRGSKEAPGLMMALKRGGRCEGAALRLADEDRHGQLVGLLRRETDSPEDLGAVRTIPVRTTGGTLEALAFWAEPDGCDYFVDYAPTQTARMLASACGHLGSGAAYLFETVMKLEELGIHDPHLWDLQRLVAEEIMARGN